jgi:hypothetical protein
MKTFIRNNSAYLISSVLFVSLCFNLRYAWRTFAYWVRTDHLMEYDLYRPVGFSLHYGGVLILLFAGCLLVRQLYGLEKRRSSGKLSKSQYAGVILTGLLTLCLPVVATGAILPILTKTIELFVFAIGYLAIVIIYLWITYRN